MAQAEHADNPYSSPADLGYQGNQSSETGKLIFKTFKYTGFTLVLLVLLQLFNIVGFFYYRRVENQPLQNPVRVVRNSNHELELADGRVITNYFAGDHLADVVKRTGSDEVEIVASEIGEDFVEVMAKDHHFICGIGGPMFTIPLFPIRTPRYDRVRVGFGDVAGIKSVAAAP
jgi:hypothetical protein